MGSQNSFSHVELETAQDWLEAFAVHHNGPYEEVQFDLVETVVRENEAVESYDLPSEPDVDCPTLLLTGEHGPEHLRAAVQTLADRVPQSRLVELDGVGHVATNSAPQRVADAVCSFSPEGPAQS